MRPVRLHKALKQVGFIPNMYANMVHSPGVLNTYLDGYAAFRKDSGFTPTEQEVMVASRGLPDREQVEAFLSAGYTERQILAIAVKTLSNYSNHLFHTQLDEKFAGRRRADIGNR